MPDLNKTTPDNTDLSYLRDKLMLFEENIKLPQSLSGAALREKLDQVEPEENPGKLRSFLDRLEWKKFFSYKSPLAYAAVFLVLITAFWAYGPAQNMSNTAGNNEMASPSQESAEQSIMDISEFAEGGPQMRMFSAELAEPEDKEKIEAPTQPFAMSDSIPQLAGSPMMDSADNIPEHNAPTGGVTTTTILGEQNEYTFIAHSNSYESAASVIVDAEVESEPVFSILIENMANVIDFHIFNDNIVFIGTDGPNTVINTYSNLSSHLPYYTGNIVQPGEKLSARIYNNIVYTITYNEDMLEVSPEIQLVMLEDSADEGICYISALDMSTGNSNILALGRSGSDVSLLDRHAYISYNVMPHEVDLGDEAGGVSLQIGDVYVAQITFDKTELNVTRLK